MKIETDDDRLILIAAFRYALGRCSYMPSVVAGVRAQCWADLTEHDQRLIKRETAEAIERGLRAFLSAQGARCDDFSGQPIPRAA